MDVLLSLLADAEREHDALLQQIHASSEWHRVHHLAGAVYALRAALAAQQQDREQEQDTDG